MSLCFALGLALATSPVRAQPSSQGVRSALEQSLIEQALQHYGLEEEPEPEGKRITEIKVYVHEVFDERDPIPDFVNIFHVRTRDFIVKQEVLQREGEIYEIGRILETERNLRSLRQISIANVVAVKGERPDETRLLVVVKDVWSLRLNSSWAYGSSGLEYLALNPTEENLAGLRATLGLVFTLERDRYSVGGNFTYPRLAGTRLFLDGSAGIFKNRSDGEAEGHYGSFTFARPQFSRHTEWAYGASAKWRFDLARAYQKGNLDEVVYVSEDGTEEAVPWLYERELIEASYYGIRSYGVEHKFDITYGLELDARGYRVPDAERYSQGALDEFNEQALPTSDTRYSPFVKLETYREKYHRVLNLESLSLQEDYALGYSVVTSVFTGAENFGSSRDHVGSSVGAGYTVPVGSGLLRFGATNRVVIANEARHEGYFSARARLAVPLGTALKLHIDGYFGYRYQDYLNVSPFRLGGDNRLRGYPSQFPPTTGKSISAQNAEIRTVGLDILSAQVGLAAFYDLGAAADSVSDFAYYQSAGAGVRILFPQAERTVLRLDWGFPLSVPGAVWPGGFFFTFGQAFPMPSSSGGGDAY